MLRVHQVRKKYGSVQAVKNASFEIAKGERFGLLGPNGAGKTTTLSIITGTTDADSGEVTLNGHQAGTKNLAMKRHIGYVPQELALYEDLDANANLRYFSSLYGVLGTEAQRAADHALDITNLRDRASHPVKTYSGGMKRRLNIAVALVHNPDVLILDEPTVGVDPQSRNAIFEALLALSASGKTLLYTTHYMEEVERLCQRIAIMDNGEVIATGSLSDLHRMLPKSDRVTIELAEPNAVLGLTGVSNLVQDGTSLTFDVADIGEGLPAAISQLTAQGQRIVALRSRTSTLEEVFLHLTGRTLRD